ncbi:hypothetical protein J2T57_001336 [Natronocella acetinitrilica]|uniref:Uncharacterized protein n=1 Tax=Natronocella acetinitrilica TaxID=414046 RepID=A0AAE3G386_9GAMM|nr:hypothetical protein [Natronocella acetinitrilica]MCP1674234.1 hypothetical protein [Natronocella acetinitrilica]
MAQDQDKIFRDTADVPPSLDDMDQEMPDFGPEPPPEFGPEVPSGPEYDSETPFGAEAGGEADGPDPDFNFSPDEILAMSIEGLPKPHLGLDTAITRADLETVLNVCRTKGASRGDECAVVDRLAEAIRPLSGKDKLTLRKVDELSGLNVFGPPPEPAAFASQAASAAAEAAPEARAEPGSPAANRLDGEEPVASPEEKGKEKQPPGPPSVIGALSMLASPVATAIRTLTRPARPFNLETAVGAKLNRLDGSRKALRANLQQIELGVDAKGNPLSDRAMRRLAGRLPVGLDRYGKEMQRLEKLNAPGAKLSEETRQRVLEQSKLGKSLADDMNRFASEQKHGPLRKQMEALQKAAAALAETLAKLFKTLMGGLRKGGSEPAPPTP